MLLLCVTRADSRYDTRTQTIDREAKLAEPSSGDGEGQRERNRPPATAAVSFRKRTWKRTWKRTRKRPLKSTRKVLGELAIDAANEFFRRHPARPHALLHV